MEGVMSLVRGVIFQPPPSLLVSAMSVVGVVSLGNAGLSELRGNHMKYSKFAAQPSASTSPSPSWSSLPSRTGMLVAYTPAFLAALSSLLLLHHGGDGASSSRIFLVESALAVHFFKRVFEQTLFLHKYSGTMAAGTAIPISVSYFSVTALTIYTQILTQEALLPEPAVDLRLYGVVLFLIGIAGNFYHHYLLSKLRSSGDDGKKKEYKIPKGGMFELVICPHYLFEILVFYGIALISQTLYSFCVAVGTSLYLMGRSKATREWYLSKFDDFPPHVKALIPFVF
ncbi:unnamed protein product [Linum tenue]|uniref:3-oxo-5-alpha-steroid 4-dehydrogenase C-terminal domain-containing protein n=2 Tax=Linum tenue TaxID=586396 RepID=A0AAV0JPE4_9ROSI|nr:unnamed protein product [Linum tenue]